MIEIRRYLGVALALTLFGCGGKSLPLRDHPSPNPEIRGEITDDKVKKALRLKVERRLEYLNAHKDEFQAEVVRTYVYEKNYFYRYYDWFPGQPDDIAIVVTPNHRTGPQLIRYEAKVTYPRERFETLYANRPNYVKETDQFVRDSGKQVEHYEFIGDRWQLQHATFDVDATAIWKDNEWAPVSRRLRRVEPKQQESFIRRMEYFFEDLRAR